jgi:hypothetical protein
MSWKFTRRRLRNRLDGKGQGMEKEVRVERVDAYETKSGNTRFVLRDADGDEYKTFKEEIARQAVAAEGKRARIEFHEQQRNGFTNVYLDRVVPLEEPNGSTARPTRPRGKLRSRQLRGSSERGSPTSRSRRASCSRA